MGITMTSLETLREALSVAPVVTTRNIALKPLQAVDVAHEAPQEKFNDLIARNPKFSETWYRRRGDLDGDQSRYDLSLCSIAAREGWTRDDQAWLIREHRGHDEKSYRIDYIERTVCEPCRQAEVPEGVFVLPNDHLTYPVAASHIFTAIAKEEDMFIHGDTVSEKAGNGVQTVLKPVRPEEFQSRIDSYGKPVMYYIKINGQLALKPHRCSKAVADVLLKTNEAKYLLPSVRVITVSPIITKTGILAHGYHPECGGVLVVGHCTPEDVPLDKAVASLLDIHKDFDFQSQADLSRAIGMMLTPALKTGGFLDVPTPLDVAEADKSQAGKGYRQQLICMVYGESRYMIAQKKGGVGSLDESLSSGLISGKQFLCFDNIRGELNSTALESLITDPERVRARVPYHGEKQIDARAVTIQISSNSMKTTVDLANRSCVVRIRKRPRDCQWRQYKEGDLLVHVKSRQAFYLGCIFTVIKEWIRLGMPTTDTTDHDMRRWAQILDWIVQNIFSLPPLLDGHVDIQTRVSHPYMNWLRDVCVALDRGCMLPNYFTATKIAVVCEEEGIEWPHGKEPKEGREHMKVGQQMAKLFLDAENEVITIEGYHIERSEEDVYSEVRKQNMTVKQYNIYKEGEECDF